MRTNFLSLQCRAAITAMLVFCGAGHAQEIPTFLRDVIRGTPEGRIQLEHRIYHLEIARELAYRTLMLSRCSNFQELVEVPRFDSFGEAILRDMGSLDPDALTIFTVDGRLQDAAVQNTLTDAQIDVIRRIMDSPQYSDFIEYLSFERAESEIAAGFVDANTGKKAPWIAATALSYLRQNRFFPLLLANISEADAVLLNRREFNGFSPSDQMAVDDGYLQELTVFFERQLDYSSLRKKLPDEIKFLMTLYENLGGDAMSSITVLWEEIPPAQQAVCKSKNVTNCIGIDWLTSAIATKKQLDYTKYQTAARIMHNNFSDLCKTNPK